MKVYIVLTGSEVISMSPIEKVYTSKLAAWKAGNKRCNEAFILRMRDWRQKTYLREVKSLHYIKQKGMQSQFWNWWYNPYPKIQFKVVTMELITGETNVPAPK